MAKTAKDKVNQLAATQVDTYINRNKNKVVHGREVRPVIQDWVDKLDDIIVSSGRDELPPDDLVRLRKAASSLKNLLKNKDDELTYIITNAPKKFWGTLQYIFNDTFGERPYNPEPLTKYEIPRGYLPSVDAKKPDKRRPGSAIPPKKRPFQTEDINLFHLPTPGPQSNALDEKEEIAKRKKEEEDKKKKEEEKKLEEEQANNTEDIPDERRVDTNWLADKLRKMNGEAVSVENKPRENYLHKQVADNNKQEELADGSTFPIDSYKKLWLKIAAKASSMAKETSALINSIPDNKVDNVIIKINSLAEELLKKVSLLNPKRYYTALQSDFSNDILPIIAEMDGIKIQEIMPDKPDFLGDIIRQRIKTILEDWEEILKYKNFKFTGEDKDELFIPAVSDLASQVMEETKKLLPEIIGKKSYLATRLAELNELSEEHTKAANSNDDNSNSIKKRLPPDYYSGNRVDPDHFELKDIETSINNYIDRTIKTKSFKDVMRLIKAAKRLSSYVE